MGVCPLRAIGAFGDSMDGTAGTAGFTRGAPRDGRAAGRRIIAVRPTPPPSEPVNESGAPERRVKTGPIKAQSTAVARATASICNAERARFDVASGRVGFVHRFSVAQQVCRDLAPMRSVPVFPQVEALPRPEHEPA